MRGPEEASSSADGSTSPIDTQDTLNSSKRDPCSSPPCKRLKQGVLSFQSGLASSSKDPSPTDVVVIDDEAPKSGGLVTAIPPPPAEGTRPGSAASAGSSNDSMLAPAEGPCPGSMASVGSLNGSVSPPAERPRPGSAASVGSSNDSVSPPAERPCPDSAVSVGSLNDSMSSTASMPSTSENAEDNSSKMDCSTACESDDTKPALIMSSPKTPNTAANSKTPARLSSAEKVKKKEERERLRAEKQKEKDEKERQRLEAKAAKEKQRLEAKQKKEQERFEKQAEKDKKERERLEKKQKEEKEKQEKKEKKDEERRKKEEEIKRKEEEKRQQEEEQLKKKKQARNSFVNFFISSPAPAPKNLPKTTEKFQPFQITKFMTLAPTCRRKLDQGAKDALSALVLIQDGLTYLQELTKSKPLPHLIKANRRNKRKQHDENVSKEEPMEVDENQIVIPDESSNSSSILEVEQQDGKKYMKAILLQFKENHRPAYYGTHRKTSKKISPRNPFKKDMVLLDYDVDSDEEWEEEEPGESLSNSEGEDEDEADDDDDGEGFFVPHGYLSDDEGVDAENEEGNPEGRQEQQMAKAKAWEAELKKKFKPLRPIAVGCLWGADGQAHDILKQFAAISLTYESTAMSCTASESSDLRDNSVSGHTPEGVHPAAMIVPEEAMPDLIQFIHGSASGIFKLVKHFKEHWSTKCQPSDGSAVPVSLQGRGHISKRQLERKIQAIAVKERRHDRIRWYVHQNFLDKYGLQGLEITRNISPASEISSETKVSPPKPGIKYVAKATSPYFAVNGHGQTVKQAESMEKMDVSEKSNALPMATGCKSSCTDVIVIGDGPTEVSAKRRIIPTLISVPSVTGAKASETVLALPVAVNPSVPSGGNSNGMDISPKANQVVGKRRITPTLISGPGVNSNKVSQPVTSSVAVNPCVPSSGSSNGMSPKANQVTGKRRIAPTLTSGPGVTSNKPPETAVITPAAVNSSAPASGSSSSMEASPKPNQVAGKRRITPTLISGPSVNSNKVSKPAVTSPTAVNANSRSSDRSDGEKVIPKPSQIVVKRRIPTTLISGPSLTDANAWPAPTAPSTGNTGNRQNGESGIIIDNGATDADKAVVNRRITPALISGPTGQSEPNGSQQSAPIVCPGSTTSQSSSINVPIGVLNGAEVDHIAAVKRPASSPDADNRAAKVPKKGDTMNTENSIDKNMVPKDGAFVSKGPTELAADSNVVMNVKSSPNQEQEMDTCSAPVPMDTIPDACTSAKDANNVNSVESMGQAKDVHRGSHPMDNQPSLPNALTEVNCINSSIYVATAIVTDTSLDCASSVGAASIPQTPLIEAGQVPKSAVTF